MAVWKVRDRELFMEVRESPLARVAYWRHALRGLWQGAFEVMGVRPFVQLVPLAAPDSAALRIAWS